MNWDRFRQLVEDTVSRLRSADGDREKIETAIRRFINQGYRNIKSPLTLYDYFSISSPSLPEKAGYCGYEAEQMIAVFERLCHEKFGK